MTFAQITAILALLLAFGTPKNTVDTVRSILIQKTPQTVVATPSEIAGTSAVTPTCVENPQLTMRIATSTRSNEIDVFGYYTTGCIIDPSIENSYNFMATQSNWSYSPGGPQTFDFEDKDKTLRFVSEENYTTPPSSFTLTIGSTTQTIWSGF